MPAALAAPTDAAPDWLTDALRRSGALEDGRVVAVERAPLAETAMWVLWRLRLAYSPDAPPTAPPRLLLKLPRAYPSDETFHILGRSREVAFYTAVAPEPAMAGVPLIRCYDAVHDLAAFGAYGRSDSHVLVDDLTDTHYSTDAPLPPPEARCAEGVSALASLHAAWWQHPRLGQGGDLAADVARVRTAAAVAGLRGTAEGLISAFLDFLSDRLSPARRRVFERLLAFESEYARRQRNRPQTLLHGDAGWWNFLYPHDPALHTTRLLDWGSWRIGVGTNDLAYLLALQWYPERRRRLEAPLLRRYHEELLRWGISGYGWEDLWADYRLSVVGGLYKVARCWAERWPTHQWWGYLERGYLAYEDLACAELLDA